MTSRSMSNRFNRQIQLFGAAGQRRIEEARIVLLGCGGLGMHVIQQLAYLGVQHWTLLDHDEVDETSLNRLVTTVPDDEGAMKLEIATRLIRSLHPAAQIDPIDGLLGDPEIEDRLAQRVAGADLVIGCFDNETPRLHTTKLGSDHGVPYIDAATDVVDVEGGLSYGGRVIVAHDGTGCLACLDILDLRELRREQMTPEQRAEHDRIYGIDHGDLEGSGPSVVTLNGVVASLACTEAMMILTGLRDPNRQLTYRGDLGGVSRNTTTGNPDCAFCAHWRERRAGVPKRGTSSQVTDESA